MRQACPKCGCNKARVLDTRPHARGTRRRLMCTKCKHRWTHYDGDDTRNEIAVSVRVLTEAVETTGRRAKTLEAETFTLAQEIAKLNKQAKDLRQRVDPQPLPEPKKPVAPNADLTLTLSFRRRADGGIVIWSDDIPDIRVSEVRRSAAFKALGNSIAMAVSKSSALEE